MLSSDAIPQHDRVDDLLRLLREPESETERISDRQRGYRHQALSILGLYDRSAKAATPFGEHVRALAEHEAMVVLLQRVRDCELFRAWQTWCGVASTAEIDPDTALSFLQACSTLAPSTAKRRSRSLHAWWRSAHADAAFHGTQAVLPLTSTHETNALPERGTAAYTVACLTGTIDDADAIAALSSTAGRSLVGPGRLAPDAELAETRDLQDLEAMLFVRLRTDGEGDARWAAFVADYNGKQLDGVDDDELCLDELGDRLVEATGALASRHLPSLQRQLRARLESAGIRRPVRSAFVVHACRPGAPEGLLDDVMQYHALRWHLLGSHLGIVGKVAQRYRLGFPYEDAFLLALGGGLDGVDRWEEHRGGSLATVVSWWARARLTRAVGNYRHGRRRSGHLNESRMVLNRIRREWVREARREPDWREIADAWLVDGQQSELGEIAPRAWCTDELDAEHRPHLSGYASLVALDAVPEDVVAELARVDGRVRTWLAEETKPRVRHVLEERFGLRGADGRTLSEIGKDLDLSRERVRQLERDGLQDLVRHFADPETTTPTT